MPLDHLYDGSPVFLLLLGDDNRVVDCNALAGARLGVAPGFPLGGLLDGDGEALLEDFRAARAPAAGPARRLLRLRRPDGSGLALMCRVDRVAGVDGRALIRLCALDDPQGEAALAELARSEETLRGLVQTSSEAMWCIEFSEPVDLTAGDQEIVRQVFENDRHWIMCNDAMARIYDLPEGLDFNQQPVSVYFRRNPENEAFVRQIIESNFCIDSGLSIDTRHDGTTIYIENTVRASIEGGRLLRLWGTVRDITGYRQAANRLQQQVRDAWSILSAIPDSVLVIDRNRKLLGVNPAFEAMLGWTASQCLGTDVQSIIDLERPLPGDRRWYGCERQRWVADVKTATGTPLLCDVQIAPIDEDAPDRFVLTLRPVQAHAEGHAHAG